MAAFATYVAMLAACLDQGSAATHDALSAHLDGMAVERNKIILEDAEPVASVRVP